ncbi:MAG: gamma-glutamyltransferase [Planctomycetota bacterium]
MLLKIVLLGTVLFTVQLLAADRITGRPFATRSEVIAPHGMAATSQPLATQIAVDTLQKGGTAVDAAIAANAALSLMEPTGCGLGGDLYAIVWDAKEKKLHGLNGSGRSPQSLTLEKLRAELAKLGRDTIPSHGPLPVSVPGCVDGWFELHGRFGKLPMSEVLAPAIAYARAGFPVSEVIAHYWGRSVPRLSQFPGFTEAFTIDGRAPEKGEMWRNPALAETLATLAKDGRDAFYRGPIATTIAKYMQQHGGYLTVDDLAQHKSTWVQPVSADYRGYDVWELPPNGQGIAALQILNILEGYDLAKMGFGSVEYTHLFIEAKKLAFEDRAKFYTDMDFSNVPVEQLISKEYAAKRRKLIDPKKASQQLPAGDLKLENGDTIYLSVADSAGNMVSLIQSNYRGMGSGMTPPGLGFILQDRGELFALDENHQNVYAPGKRPFHTIIPAFVTREGKPWLSFGVMGGAAQPQMHAQVLINMIDFGMNLQEAGDAARIYHGGSSKPTGKLMTDGGAVSLEGGIPEATRNALAAMGHTVSDAGGMYGGYQAVLFDAEKAVYVGASESRKDGAAAGY